MKGTRRRLVCSRGRIRRDVCEGLNLLRRSGADSKECSGPCASEKKTQIFLAVMRPGDTPVPIPNTKVKAWPADGTALETVWESRWPPDSKKEKLVFTSD